MASMAVYLHVDELDRMDCHYQDPNRPVIVIDGGPNNCSIFFNSLESYDKLLSVLNTLRTNIQVELDANAAVQKPSR